MPTTSTSKVTTIFIKSLLGLQNSDEARHLLLMETDDDLKEVLAAAPEGCYVARISQKILEERGVVPCEERNEKFYFEGFVIDAFITQSGDLGMTIERAPAYEDNPSVDVFVDKATLEVHAV